MDFLQYFNLPFDTFIDKADLKSRFNLYSLNNIEKFYIKQIINFYAIANLDDGNINRFLGKEDPSYKQISFYILDIKNINCLSQIVNLLYKIIKRPAIFIIHCNKITFISCGNVSYTKKDLDYNHPIKCISSSFDENFLTYNNKLLLKALDYTNMKGINSIFDYICEIYLCIGRNRISYIKTKFATMYIKFLFGKEIRPGIILEDCIVKKKVGKILYYEEEDLWRSIVKYAKKQELVYCNNFYDVKVEYMRHKDRLLYNVSKEKDEIKDEIIIMQDYPFLKSEDINKINININDDFSCEKSQLDYSEKFSFLYIIKCLFEYGIADEYGNQNITKKGFVKIGEKKCRQIFNYLYSEDIDFYNNVSSDTEHELSEDIDFEDF